MLSKAGTAEQSAVESLNLLQQMPSMLDYFPSNVGPKTPLNTVISPTEDQFDVAKFIKQESSVNKPLQPVEDLVDIETNKASPVNLMPEGKHNSVQKLVEKHKSSAPPAEKLNHSSVKNLSKKASSGHSKTVLPASKVGETKKRKSSTVDHDKVLKKAKNVDKKKLQIKKREKHAQPYMPRSSKLSIYEDGRVPSLFPPGHG